MTPPSWLLSLRETQVSPDYFYDMLLISVKIRAPILNFGELPSEVGHLSCEVGQLTSEVGQLPSGVSHLLHEVDCALTNTLTFHKVDSLGMGLSLILCT